MKLRLLRDAALTSVLALSFALVPVMAFALEAGPGPVHIAGGPGSLQPRDTNGTKGDDTKTGSTGSNASGETQNGTETGLQGQHRLAGNLLKVCAVRSMNINEIMTRVVVRGTRQSDLFATIATRVENYYTSSGKTLDNYDQLVAAVNAAATQSQTDLSTLKSLDKFSCGSSDPKGQLATFRTDVQTEIKDLKAYRSAVRYSYLA